MMEHPSASNAAIIVGIFFASTILATFVDANPPVGPRTGSRGYCNASMSWSCYTVQPGDNIFDLAAKFHVHPQQLCDYNRDNILNCSILFPEVSIRIPRIACNAVPGAYECFVVSITNDSVCNISKHHSLVSCSDLMAYNQDLLYLNAQTLPSRIQFPCGLYKGMFLRIPLHHCVPTEQNGCYTVQEGDTLYSIAGNFYINAETLLLTNLDLIDGDAQIRVGMELKIPYFCEDAPGQYFCYKVQSGDTLYALGNRFNMPWNTLCSFNKISNCSKILTEDIDLRIPIYPYH